MSHARGALHFVPDTWVTLSRTFFPGGVDAAESEFGLEERQGPGGAHGGEAWLHSLIGSRKKAEKLKTTLASRV
jgi:hypothetical protein